MTFINKKQLFIVLILVVFCLQACKDYSKISDSIINENKTDSLSTLTPKLNNKNTIPNEFKSQLRPNEKIELGKTYTDTVHFIEFNDELDEWAFIVEKNKDTIGLIHNQEQQTKFVKGDELAINWKMDSIRYAGDSEYLAFTEFLLSTKKIKSLQLKNKKIKFLWRETKYDKDLKTEINSIVLNEKYIKTISEPEKAALAYLATFIGNECEWDGNPNENRSNLICKILWALDLRYQCSYEHNEFLKYWFRNNKNVLIELKNCPTTPDGATIQDTFDEINLEVKDNKIIIFFKASGINLREGKSWNWTEKHFYEFKKNELIIIKKEVSPIKHETIEIFEK